MRTHTGRAGAVVAAAALLVCTSTPAEAATTAKASSVSQAVSSGTWGAVATLSPAPYGPGPLTLTFANNGNPAQPSFTPQYFTVGNTGTLPLTRAGYTGTADAPSTVQFIIESCSTGWVEEQDVCQGGTPSTVLEAGFGSPADPVTSATVPAVPGTSIRLRARIETTGNVPKKSTSTLTIDVTVTRAQVRAATRTGS
ncbi:hypothetical protein [Pseudarthrobacter sp. PvP090]|uniref:hypothetical protein n=1 Tax=Pseudarthrobacter sp. PvP090 TaxID=3156393 RepID=UPI00339AF078